MTKSEQLFYSGIFFIGSIGIASFLPERILKNDLWLFIILIIFLSLLIIFWQKKFFRFIFLLFFLFFSALWRYSLSLPTTLNGIWHYNEKQIIFNGVVYEEPQIFDNKERLKIRSQKLKIQDNKWVLINGNVLIVKNLYPNYNYGDFLEISCKLNYPSSNENFSYDRYLARYNIYSICYYPKITLISKKQNKDWRDYVIVLKNKVRSIIEKNLAYYQAGLANGILLGDQKNLDKDLEKKFSYTGLSHIIAISGTNINIVVAIIMSFCFSVGISRKKAFYFSTIFIIVYIIVIGAPASAVRAGIMGFIILWAWHIGRLNKAINALILAAIIILIFNPRMLRDDISFQLSFLATLGLIYFYPIFNAIMKYLKIPLLWGARDAISISLAAQIMTIPLIVYYFNIFSLVALLTNFLTFFILPIIIFILPIAVFLGNIFPYLTSWFFIPVSLLLTYLIFIVEKFSNFSYAYLNWKISFVIVIFFYVFIYAFYQYFKKRDFIKNEIF